MKQTTKSFSRIIFIILLGLVLITCKKENQLIFNDDIETVKHAVEPTSGYTPGYFLDLIATIEGMVNDGLLNEDNGSALISKINSVIISIEKGNENAVSGQLGSFIKSTEALVNNGIITEDKAQSAVAETGIILLDGYYIDPNDGSVSRGMRTSFNVKAYKNHDNIEVTVSSGKVAVYRSEKPDERIVLIKGQKAVFYKTTKKIEVSVN